MTYNEITLWRHFMESKGILNNFEYLYRGNRFDKRELNQFLEEVEAESVILSAFDFSSMANTVFSYKYWKGIHALWIDKLNAYRTLGEKIPESQVTCPHCKRTLSKSLFRRKSNGVLHKHCMECESGAWDRKRREQLRKEKEQASLEKKADLLEKECEENNNKLNSITKVCSRCGERKLRSYFYKSAHSADGLQGWCISCQSRMEKVAERMDDVANNRPDLSSEVSTATQVAGFEKITSPKLGEYDASFHFREGKKSITFNASLSDILLKGNYTNCYLKTERSNRLYLVFNRIEGANLVNVSSRSSVLLGINSAEYCRTIASRFNVDLGEIYYLHITKNLSRTNDVVTIEIISIRTKEEFMSIATNNDSAPKIINVPTLTIAPKEENKNITEQKEANNNTAVVPAANEKMTADTIIQHILDRNIVTERDLAAFLHKKGWKLQEPVTSYKKFTLD